MTLEGRVLGEFTLREQIGEGGFATVYRAEQPALEREAVVKVLHARLAGRPDVARRFLREARLASRLDHPYAAHVYAFGAEPDGTLWIAMELVRGTPMDRWIESKGPLALEQLVPLFERVCEVVQTAHERGIVHRDLKPGNVMILARAGRLLPKLLDFGIARVLDDDRVVPAASAAVTPADGGELDRTMDWEETPDAPADATRAGTALGSPAYMAPEQWVDASSAGPPTDIYALGVLVYEALTGRQPFTGPTAMAMMNAHVGAAPPPLGGTLPVALDDVIARALAKQAHLRHASAGELAAAIRAASGLGEPESLPQLPAPLHDAWIANAPQPIAEAIAALDGARNVDQACALVIDIAIAAVRWVGVLALASRTRVGPGPGGDDGESVAGRLRALGRDGLADDEWLDLARLLVRGFAATPGAHPIPPLVDLLHGARDATPFVDAFRRLHELRGALDRRAGRSQAQRHELHAEALDAIARLLEPMRVLLPYTVVVPRDGRKERWRGPRRATRPAIVGGDPLPDGDVVLVDGEAANVLRLSPLIQIRRPAPGKPEEMFVIDGRDANGGRLVALPYGYTHHDGALGDWLRGQFDLADDGHATATDDAEPYRGLSPFTTGDADYYVGREREVETFVNRLRDEALLAVVGPSGAGKSSFVQAGVVPALPDAWTAIVVRPGATPLATLEARLRRDGIEIDGLADDPSALAAGLRRAAGERGAPIVVVVDQLEELFTLCRDDRERRRYADALADAARSLDDPFRVVVTLRDDFLVRCEALDRLRDLIARGVFLLDTPSPDDLERIVSEPARRAGYQLEDRALAGEMADDVAGQPGALALLSFTAAELWKLRDRHFRQLTRKAYVAIGGVAGALARHAESVLDALPAHDARLVREAFRHLVTAEGTRQVVSAVELRQALTRAAGGDGRAQPVIDRLIAARLVVVSDDDRVEVIHEALFRAWPRLAGWIREDAEGARLRDQLRIAARQWDVRGRSRGLLWRGDALAEYRLWRARYPGALTDVEVSFASASLRDAARSRRLRRAALATAFAVLAAGLAITLYLRGEATDAQALAEHRQARIQRQLRDSHVLRGRQALLAGDTATARDALHAARTEGASGPALDVMMSRAMAPLDAELATLTGHAGKILTIAFDPSGTRLLTAGEDGTARLWDAATGTQLHQMPGDVAAWSPDGARFATLDKTGALTLWSAAGDKLRSGIGHAATPHKIVFRADGSLIATSTLDGHVVIWDAERAAIRATWRAGASPVNAIAFDPTRDHMLTTGTQPAVWSLDGRRLFTLDGHSDPVWQASFDPNGTSIVTGSLDSTIRIWDAATGAPGPVLRGHERRVTCVALDEGGRILVSGGTDTTVRVWDLEREEPIAILRGHAAQVNWVGFTPDDHVVSTSSDGTARVWDPVRGLEVAVLAHGGFVGVATVDVGGRRAATASWTGSAKLWDLASQSRAAVFDHPTARYVHAEIWNPVRVSANHLVRIGRRGVAVWDTRGGGRRAPRWVRDVADDVTNADVANDVVAVIDRRGIISSFDAGDGTLVSRIDTGTTGSPKLALDPRGGRVLASHGGSIAAWELGTGARVASTTLPGVGYDDEVELLFAPDGSTAVASIRLPSAIRTAWLLDRELAIRATLEHERWISSVAYDHLGRLATGSWDGVLKLWTADGQPIATLPHDGGLVALKWTSDGSRIVAGIANGALTVWEVRTTEPIARVDAHAAHITSLDISDDSTFVVTAGGDHEVRLWELADLAPVYELHAGTDYVDHVAFVRDQLVTSTPSGSDMWRLR